LVLGKLAARGAFHYGAIGRRNSTPGFILFLADLAARSRPIIRIVRAKRPGGTRTALGDVTRPGVRMDLALADPSERFGLHGGGDPMATARLRVFPRPEEETRPRPSPASVPVRLADLYPLLAQAYRDNYVWLRDFEDEEILVSDDLNEVVRAFSNIRPSA
jgi:hypothetical protein